MTYLDTLWHAKNFDIKKDISDTMKKKIMYFRRRKSMIFGQQKSKLCFMQRSHENKLGNFFGKKMKNVVDLGICLPCQFWHFYSTQLGQKIENAKKIGKTCTWLSGNDPYFCGEKRGWMSISSAFEFSFSFTLFIFSVFNWTLTVHTSLAGSIMTLTFIWILAMITIKTEGTITFTIKVPLCSPCLQ